MTGVDERVDEHDLETPDWGGADTQLRFDLQDVLSTRTLAEWTQLGADAGLPISPAHQSLTDFAVDPQIATRGVFIGGTHPVAGEVSYVGSAARIDGQDFRVRRHAPAPGEHSQELLAELGLPGETPPRTLYDV